MHDWMIAYDAWRWGGNLFFRDIPDYRQEHKMHAQLSTLVPTSICLEMLLMIATLMISMCCPVRKPTITRTAKEFQQLRLGKHGLQVTISLHSSPQPYLLHGVARLSLYHVSQDTVPTSDEAQWCYARLLSAWKGCRMPDSKGPSTQICLTS
jgi:hypothetical protein